MAGARREERGPPRNRRADAETSEAIGGAQVAARRVNTLNVFTRSLTDPGFALKAFPLAAPQIPAASRQQPSRLLAARYRVVPFSERAAEVNLLAQWRDHPGFGTAVRLLHGAGGEGKTRLAAEFASASARAGWEVSEPTRDIYGESTVVIGAAKTRRQLLIVDYAERWLPSDLLDLIHAPMLRDSDPLRILLLARPAGSWWESLEYDLGESEIATDKMLLAPLATNLDARERMFTAARDEFARILGVTRDERLHLPASVFANDAYRMVLTIQMAALAVVHAALRNEMAPSDPVTVTEYLLQREREHWRRLYRNSEAFGTRPEVMARVVYTAILTHQVPYDVGVTVLDRVGIATSTETASQVLDDHARCYPPAHGVLEPMYPDRLAEDFIALQTPGHPAISQQDQWAATAVGRLLALEAGRPVPEWAAQAITVLVEVSRRWRHFAESQLYPLLMQRPWLGVAGGGQLLSRLAGIPDMDPEVLFAVEASLPTGARVDLDAGIAEITARIAAERLISTTDDEARGDIYRNLGWRQANAGLFDEAAQASFLAVQILERLASSERVQSKLAQALSDLGRSEAELGNADDALAATDSAVTIYRQLIGNGALKLESRLAAALTALGRDWWYLDRDEQALAATNESVQMYRRLVHEQDGAPEAAGEKAAKRSAALARSLRNLGVMLSGRDAPAALAAAKEAVDILTELAAADPPAYEVDLAMALNNLGVELAIRDSHEEALAATRQAVGIGQRIVQVNPAAVQPKLALWSFNLGKRLIELGHTQDGLQSLAEATEIRRKLAQASPAICTSVFGTTLSAFASCLVEAGRAQDAVPVTTEALDCWRALAQGQPLQYDRDLARALWLSASVRAAADRDLPEALDNAEESIAIYRALTAAEPAAYEYALGEAVSLAADLMTRLGRSEDAAAMCSIAPADLPPGPWLEALLAEPVESVETVLREVSDGPDWAGRLADAVANSDVYVLRDPRDDQGPAGADGVIWQVTLERQDGTAFRAAPIFSDPVAILMALAGVAGSQRLRLHLSSGRAVLTEIGADVFPVINPWTELQRVLPSRSARAADEFLDQESFGLEHVEAVLAEAGRRSDQAQAVRAAVYPAEVFALGQPAGDTSIPGRGTESDLLHFAIDLDDGECVMLPVFTNAAVMREALLRNPEWQQWNVLSINGGALLDNVDDEVVVVINPWSDLEFQIPSRLTAGTAAPPEQDGSPSL